MDRVAASYAARVRDAMLAVFGESPLTMAVHRVCDRYESDVANIQESRGIDNLLIAVVGAKGQGKTWVVRQFLRDEVLQSRLRSGDLAVDATTRLVWVGPVAPANLDPTSEDFVFVPSGQMVELGQSYTLLDMPGLTDADQRAAALATEALSLAPIKLLVVARDQLRAAANLTIAKQIDGCICIPIITSADPEEMPLGSQESQVQQDISALLEQLNVMASHTQLTSPVLVPDFEITGDEKAAGQCLVGGVLDRVHEMSLTRLSLGNSIEVRSQAALNRMKSEVVRLISNDIPQLSDAVEQLNREAERLPSSVLDALLGSEEVLETGVRMRLRAKLASDTGLIWFPYRTTLNVLNLTQGAWDRVMLALAGSVPSLFGALTSWARNIRQNREFSAQIQDGIKTRTQQQVEERLKPLCDHFHRAVMKLRPRSERTSSDAAHGDRNKSNQSRRDSGSSAMRLTGIDELQTRSQQIFESNIQRAAVPNWLVQMLALVGVLVFWLFMAGPIVVIYRDYLFASLDVLTGNETHLESFPHPTPGLIFTSVVLSMLPLAIYCMLVMTWTLGRRRIRRATKSIVDAHGATIIELKQQHIIRLEFEDEVLQQAEFLLNLGREA